MKVLIVEDETKVQNFIRNGLKSADIAADTASTLAEMDARLKGARYDAIILDRLLDGVDSLDRIPLLRVNLPDTRIIVLSALSDVDDRIDGLTEGADDYLGKPFHVSELIARLRALCRRTEDTAQKEHILSFKDVTVNLNSQVVERAGKRIELTAKEYKLLVYLMKKPGRIATKTDLIDSVWELHYYPESNIVEVLVNHLRSKIDKGFENPLIHSKRGTGYWFGEKQSET